MTTRVTMGADGEAHSQELPSILPTTSSNDYDTEGITARTGPAGFATKVQNVSDLNDNDLVMLGDMELRVGDARAMGLLDQIVAASKAQGTPAEQPQQQANQSQQGDMSDTGHADYDAVVDALNAAIEEGSISFAEGQTYDTAVAEIAMAGLTTDQAILTLGELNSGKLTEGDIPSEALHVIRNAEAQVTDAATRSAKGELGDAAFGELQQLASAIPGVNDVITRYAIDRSLGRNDGVTWSDLHEYIKEQLQG